jgi:hypothetical protein
LHTDGNWGGGKGGAARPQLPPSALLHKYLLAHPRPPTKPLPTHCTPSDAPFLLPPGFHYDRANEELLARKKKAIEEAKRLMWKRRAIARKGARKVGKKWLGLARTRGGMLQPPGRARELATIPSRASFTSLATTSSRTLHTAEEEPAQAIDTDRLDDYLPSSQPQTRARANSVPFRSALLLSREGSSRVVPEEGEEDSSTGTSSPESVKRLPDGSEWNDGNSVPGGSVQGDESGEISARTSSRGSARRRSSSDQGSIGHVGSGSGPVPLANDTPDATDASAEGHGDVALVSAFDLNAPAPADDTNHTLELPAVVAKRRSSLKVGGRRPSSAGGSALIPSAPAGNSHGEALVAAAVMALRPKKLEPLQGHVAAPRAALEAPGPLGPGPTGKSRLPLRALPVDTGLLGPLRPMESPQGLPAIAGRQRLALPPLVAEAVVQSTAVSQATPGTARGRATDSSAGHLGSHTARSEGVVTARVIIGSNSPRGVAGCGSESEAAGPRGSASDSCAGEAGGGGGGGGDGGGSGGGIAGGDSSGGGGGSGSGSGGSGGGGRRGSSSGSGGFLSRITSRGGWSGVWGGKASTRVLPILETQDSDSTTPFDVRPRSFNGRAEMLMSNVSRGTIDSALGSVVSTTVTEDSAEGKVAQKRQCCKPWIQLTALKTRIMARVRRSPVVVLLTASLLWLSRLCARITRSDAYDKFVVCCIILNAVSIASEYHGMPAKMATIENVVEVVFASVFTFGRLVFVVKGGG